MGKHAEIVKFDAAVDKAAAAWVAEWDKAVKQFKTSITAATDALRAKVSRIPAPKGAPENEFAALKDSINETIAKRASGKKIFGKLSVNVDAKARSLDISGTEIRYPTLD
jgi:hypothetical protein